LKPKKIKTIDLVVIASLMAIEIILTRFLAFETPLMRISFGFLPMAIMGIMYGPLWTGAAYVATDLLGMFAMPRAMFHPGFTLTALLSGVIYGFVLHNKVVTWPRVLVAASLVSVFCNLVLDTIWLHQITGSAIMVLLPMRILRTGIRIPLRTVLISLLWKRCAYMFAKITGRQVLTLNNPAVI